MDDDLDAKLTEKEKRSSSAHQELRRAARARRLGYERNAGAGSEYLAGGSVAATAALAANLLKRPPATGFIQSQVSAPPRSASSMPWMKRMQAPFPTQKRAMS